MNRRIFDLAQKAVDNRAFQKNLPAGARRLSEYNVRDFVFAGEFEQRVGDVGGFQSDDFRAHIFSETDVFLQSGVSLRRDASRVFVRRFDIDGKPIAVSVPPDNARAGANEFFRRTALKITADKIADSQNND